MKEAIELKRKRKAISLFFQYDDVWCVFDTEGPQYTPTHFLSAIRLAEENNIKLSISNPCFEFWILLHYTDQASGLAHDCAEIVKRIKKENPSYYKGNCAIFDSIHSEVDTAIERARYLCENHHIDEDILDRNPSTEVYKLVEFLKSISPES